MKRCWLAVLWISILKVCTGQDYVHPLGHYNSQQPNYNRTHDTVATKWFFVSINAGLSQPARDYGAEDTAHNFILAPFLPHPDSLHAKGFATFGYHIDITGGAYLLRHLGVIAKIGVDRNNFDQNGFVALMSNYYNPPLQALTFTFDGGYTVWQYMGGIFGNFPLSPASSIWAEAMVGGINANYPTSTISYQSSNYIIATLKNATGTGYSFDVGFEDMLNSYLGLMINFSYSFTSLYYPGVSYKLNGFGYPLTYYTQTAPILMKYGSEVFTMGFNFHL